MLSKDLRENIFEEIEEVKIKTSYLKKMRMSKTLDDIRKNL